MIKYIKIKDDRDDRDVKEIIYATQLLQLDTIEDGFITFFKQIKHIYDD